jgi:hypothetical protein
MMTDRVRIQKTTSITAFLGAGASVPFGYPTTRTFLERFGAMLGPSDIKLAYLNSLRNLHRVKDIENVVEILDSILKMEDYDARMLNSYSSIRNFLYDYPRSLDFGKKTDRTMNIPVLEGQQRWTELTELSTKLRDSVEDFVFQQYESDTKQYSGIKDIMGGFFSVLKKHSSGKQAFEVFTTNYDNVVEDYCSEAGYACSLSEVNHEQQPRVGKISEEKFILTKLHGALNWLGNKQTKEIRVIDVQTRVGRNARGRWNMNEYVLFGTKARLGEVELYDKLFSRLEKCLNETSICVVVGFRFRDSDINKIFRKALESNKTLRMLIVSNSPTNSLMNLINDRQKLKSLQSEKRIIKLKCRFKKKEVVPAIDKILSSL